MSGLNYGKCSKISNIWLFLFSNKMLVFRAGIHKMVVRIANREDPEQTASSVAVCSGSALFVLVFRQATSVRNFRSFIKANVKKEWKN